MTSIEIKARIFDILAAMEQPQNQLNQLNQLKNQKLQELQAALQAEAQQSQTVIPAVQPASQDITPAAE